INDAWNTARNRPAGSPNIATVAWDPLRQQLVISSEIDRAAITSLDPLPTRSLFVPAVGLLAPSAQRGKVQNVLMQSQGDIHSALAGDPLNPGYVFVSGSGQFTSVIPNQRDSQAGNKELTARIFYVNTNQPAGQQPQVVGVNASGTFPHADSRAM